MGSEFPANAMFIRTKDSFRLGTIVNRKTMKTVKEWSFRGFTPGKFSQLFSIVTKPCYEMRSGNIPVDAFFNRKITLNIQGADKDINRDLNSIIRSSASTGVETGAWLNAEMTDALGKILDTARDAERLAYKACLLDSDNIVLIRSANITNISFFIKTQQPLPKKVQALLRKKPYAVVENSNYRAQLFLLDDNNFELVFSGIFQVMGQFMRCELQ
jgi:hypothetical protein